ncbi:MAG: nitroreductase family protein [Candidatus Geothermincolia bacterium]
MLFEHMRNTYLPARRDLWSNPEIVIDPEKCKGCGNCAATCPMDYLEMWQKTARLKDTGTCFGCSNCLAVCKEGAITQRGFYNVSQGLFKTQHLHPEDGYPKLPPVDGVEGMTPVEEAIYKRRSNRLFTKDPVPDDILRRIIEAGRFAPSAGNNQPWSFMVVDRPVLDSCIPIMEPMYKLLMKFYGMGKSNALVRAMLGTSAVVLPRLMDQRAMQGAQKTVRPKDVFLGAPNMIIVLGDKRGIANMDLDVGICAQNMVLAAHSLGVATCYLGFFTAACDFIPILPRKIGIKWPFKAVTAMVVGYPRVQTDNLVPREQPRITWHKDGKTWEEMP